MFNTLEFACLFGVAFLVTWGLRNRTQARIIALIALSAFFFARANLAHPARLLDPAHYSALKIITTCLSLLFFSSVLDFLTAERIARTDTPRARRALLALSVSINLLILCTFKYFNFFAAEVSVLFRVRAPHLHWLSPIGISFYTFQTISYVTDVYRGKARPAKEYTSYLLYLIFFPQLLMGPIVRAADLLPKLNAPPTLTAEGGSRAIFRIGLGLVKKSAVADFLRMHAVDPVFSNPRMYSSLEILVAVYAYAVQIYMDFSAYTDIAVGTAALLGVEIPENFNSPYLATSLRDFWHRWHITLSTWLRDYLYIPLGGSRKPAPIVYLNLFVTMVLGGLWHGASMNFLIWGAIHGVVLVLTRAASGLSVLRAGPQKLRTALGILLTFHIVTTAWVFFRAATLKGALDVFKGLFAMDFGTENISAPALSVLLIAGLSHLVTRPRFDKIIELFHRIPAPVQALLFVGAAYGAEKVAAVKVSAFIYSQY